MTPMLLVLALLACEPTKADDPVRTGAWDIAITECLGTCETFGCGGSEDVYGVGYSSIEWLEGFRLRVSLTHEGQSGQLSGAGWECALDASLSLDCDPDWVGERPLRLEGHFPDDRTIEGELIYDTDLDPAQAYDCVYRFGYAGEWIRGNGD